MHEINRRTFLSAAAGGAMIMAGGRNARAADAPARKFSLHLNVGNVNVKANQVEAIRLAKQYGFQSVAAMPWEMQSWSDAQMQEAIGQLKDAGLQWGSASIPTFFEADDGRFAGKRDEIAKMARALQRAGVTRCATYVMSSQNNLTYRETFALHVRRVREIGKLLGDGGIRLGLEYLGTRTLTLMGKFPFVRSLAEMRELIAEVGLPNIGLVLDTWHWWQAGDTGDDLLKLTDRDIVLADLCDAPAGKPREQMSDSPRRLPCTTGVIDIKPFLQALVKIGYQGPLGTEPFDRSLGDTPTEQTMQTVTASMKKAMALLD